MLSMVYNGEGQRKYLTSSEVDSFLEKARNTDVAVHTFCWMLAVSGCRISEALALTESSIDFETKHVVIQSLKKRGKRVFRAVPLPSELLGQLKAWLQSGRIAGERLWPWSRMTGYRRICEVMRAAGISGDHATPKGLRHGFGVRAIQSNVPLTLIQRWLGHADIKTTAIYTSAMGPEEREFASRMWGRGKGGVQSRVKASQPKRGRDRSPDGAASPSIEPASLCTCCGAQNGRKSASQDPIIEPTEVLVATGFSRLKSIFSCPVIHFWLKRHSNYPYYSCGCVLYDAIMAPGDGLPDDGSLKGTPRTAIWAPAYAMARRDQQVATLSAVGANANGETPEESV